MSYYNLSNAVKDKILSVLGYDSGQSLNFSLNKSIQPTIDVTENNKGKKLIIPSTAGNSSYTLKFQKGFKLSTLRLKIVCDGTAANRLLDVRFVDEASDVLYALPEAAAATASQTKYVSYAIGSHEILTATYDNGNIRLPDVWFDDDVSLVISCTAGVAGDAITGVAYVVELS